MEISNVTSSSLSTMDTIKSSEDVTDGAVGINFQELIGILFQNIQMNNPEVNPEGNIKDLNSDSAMDIPNKLDGILNLIEGNKNNKEIFKFIDEAFENGGIKDFNDLLSILKGGDFSDTDVENLIKNLVKESNVLETFQLSKQNTSNNEEISFIDSVNDMDKMENQETSNVNNLSLLEGSLQGDSTIKKTLIEDLKDNQSNTAVIKNPRDIADVVVTRFKALRLPESTEIRVKLRPEELGEVTIKLVLEKGQINGSILTEKREVAAAIQSQIADIKEQLRDNRVNLNSLTVNVNQEDTGERRNYKDQRQNNKENEKKFIEAFEEKINEAEGFNIFV